VPCPISDAGQVTVQMPSSPMVTKALRLSGPAASADEMPFAPNPTAMAALPVRPGSRGGTARTFQDAVSCQPLAAVSMAAMIAL